jgi:hypothetical protein
MPEPPSAHKGIARANVALTQRSATIDSRLWAPGPVKIVLIYAPA